MTLKRLIFVPTLLLLLAGCAAHDTHIGPAVDFGTRVGADAIPLPTPAAAPAPHPPIVRIIKGTPVDSLEAAQRRLTTPPEATLHRGMQEPLHSLILRGVSVRVIAELLTDACDYNVVATNQVAEREITIYLKQLTLREALESICRLNNLWYREGRGVITLMTREEYVRDMEVRQSDQTRAFYIRYTNAADMAKVIQAAMGSEVHLAVVENEKIYGHIDPEEQADVRRGGEAARELIAPSGAPVAGSIEGVVSAPPSGSRPLLAILTVFKRNNCIVARSLDSGLLNEMARIIEALDTPTSEVLLEIKILQLTLNDSFESFFDFNFTDEASADDPDDYTVGVGMGGTTTIGSNTLALILDGFKLDARIQYFKSQGNIEIISTPFLMAANNSKVEFFVGEETPLRDDVTTTTVPIGDSGDTMTTFEVKIVRKELGTSVNMTTFINEDGTVTLEFAAEISSALLNYSSISVINEKSGETVEFPLDATSKSEIKSILTARSGQSIAIGGIIKENLELVENKVPLLGDIPLLGFFFKEINKTKRKTETVIVLKPHVIQHPGSAGAVSDRFLGRKSSHAQITKGKENLLERTPEPPAPLIEERAAPGGGEVLP